MDDVGADYSGEYGFIETKMYWPLAHMVAPKEDSVSCDGCHSKDGRLANLTDFYLPGRDSNYWLDLIGWLAVIGTFGGVLTHGLVRYFFSRRRKSLMGRNK